MEVNYTRNYIKIYFWQGISLILNFMSMFIVIPYITSNPNIFGIYTICVSLSIYLAYADLGFVGAGQKYAAEHYIKNERKEEIEIIGFISFILLVFLAMFSFCFIILHFNPNLLIPSLKDGDKVIASSLFLILALATPITLIQRQVQIIYSIRLEEFIVQRISTIGNILKICSVLWFFRSNHYEIVNYFLFMQLVNLLIASSAFFLAIKRYDYNYSDLFKNIKFSKKVFIKTKKLAFNSLFLIITGILIYELDPTAIVFFLGTKQVANYAIGLTLLSFFRSIFSIIYSPFNARFNHLIGSLELKKLKELYLESIINTFPIVFIPILTIILLAKPIILTWVGIGYLDSIYSTRLLIAINFFAFVAYPTSILLMAQERVKEMYLISAFNAVFYWIGIMLTIKYFGINSFALFKFISFLIVGIFYFSIMFKYLDIGIISTLKKIVFPIFLPVVFLFLANQFLFNFLPLAKSKINFLIVLIYAGMLVLVSFIILVLTTTHFKDKLIHILKYK
jgi:O-antigen/teichoic acid export membrane protein